ncbi:cobyrinic acid a,c-diamide synthase [delta proteobacterium NaphS2]|nr:cobyrinic acid a,c-diamide synthase [delta proteobacterium NaphS2]
MDIPAFVIAGTHSGCGKTTVSLGIMAALVRRRLKVQAFKVGPDFIDPGHHRRMTGRDSHNLDGWIMDRGNNRKIFFRGAGDADAVVVEGVMGLFDGFSGSDASGSTAQMAKWLDLPVILVIDARAMAGSAAAVALGFLRFDPELRIGGIIFNRVGSETHAQMLKEAVSTITHVPVFGCLPRSEALEMPSRHLGLVTDEDLIRDHDHSERLGRWIETHVDLDGILALHRMKRPETEIMEVPPELDTRIGIAKDEAFCFYYPENLRLLRQAGAQLVPFSPMRSKSLPEEIHGLYLGGGYPELNCRVLAENRSLLKAIRDFGMDGRPIYAECGGFMFLMREIEDLEGRVFPMVGLFPMRAKMDHRLKSLGYREIETLAESILGPAGIRVRGHEFHYSHMQNVAADQACIYRLRDRKAVSGNREGFVQKRVLGSYVHLHWGSNPEAAHNFATYCRQCGQSRTRKS